MSCDFTEQNVSWSVLYTIWWRLHDTIEILLMIKGVYKNSQYFFTKTRYPHKKQNGDRLYQLSQKCVTYRKYELRSILHFSLGEIGMGRNIMCFLSWLACFLFFANIGYRACPSKLLEWISSVCGFYGD